MLQPLRERNLNLHAYMSLEEVVMNLRLQDFNSLGDGTVPNYVLYRFLHAREVAVHFVVGGL